jgi:hypothetical protein
MAVYTWEGNVAGKRRQKELWSYSGEHRGRFVDAEVFSADGAYMGELRMNRLLTVIAKKGARSIEPYDQPRRRGGSVPPVGVVGRILLEGCEDFPADPN